MSDCKNNHYDNDEDNDSFLENTRQKREKLWPHYNYAELTCKECDNVLFHHYKRPPLPPFHLPMDFYRCHRCGGSDIKKRKITQWEALRRDPFKKRRTSKFLL